MPGENKSWQNDWETFVRSVAELFCKGFDDAGVTEVFAGKQVLWVGTVSGKRLEITRPGIQMKMPAIQIQLPDNRRAKVDFLFLTLIEGERELWKNIEVGARISFNTKIERSTGLSPGIEWAKDDSKDDVILLMTAGARPVDVF